jgi:hypothetical protein
MKNTDEFDAKEANEGVASGQSIRSTIRRQAYLSEKIKGFFQGSSTESSKIYFGIWNERMVCS